MRSLFCFLSVSGGKMKLNASSWLTPFLFLFLFNFSATAAEEPSYCKLENFQRLEISNDGHNLERLHVYKLGQVTLAGLAIGHSEATDVQAMSEHFSRTTSQEGYCTWYLNE